MPAPSLNAWTLRRSALLPDPNALTVYVVRSNWGDGGRFVKISADNAMAAETCPTPMVRFKVEARNAYVHLWISKESVKSQRWMVKLARPTDFFGSMERFGHGRARLYGRLTARMQFGKGLTRGSPVADLEAVK